MAGTMLAAHADGAGFAHELSADAGRRIASLHAEISRRGDQSRRSRPGCRSVRHRTGCSKQLKGKSISAAGITALVALAAAASLAFITVAQAQQQKKPGPPAARAAPAPRAAAPAARPAPAPRAVARPSSPPPQRSVSRPPPPQRSVSRPPPPQRNLTRPTPPQRTATPNRPVSPNTTTRVRPNTPPQRTAVPNGPIGTPQSGRRTITQGPRGPAQVGQSPTGLRFGPHGPIATTAHLRRGPNALQPVRPKFPVVTVNNRYFPIFRGQKFMHMGGRNRFFVPLGALGAVLIGRNVCNIVRWPDRPRHGSLPCRRRHHCPRGHLDPGAVRHLGLLLRQ
jgi:hypothetical protein